MRERRGDTCSWELFFLPALLCFPVSHTSLHLCLSLPLVILLLFCCTTAGEDDMRSPPAATVPRRASQDDCRRKQERDSEDSAEFRNFFAAFFFFSFQVRASSRPFSERRSCTQVFLSSSRFKLMPYCVSSLEKSEKTGFLLASKSLKMYFFMLLASSSLPPVFFLIPLCCRLFKRRLDPFFRDQSCRTAPPALLIIPAQTFKFARTTLSVAVSDQTSTHRFTFSFRKFTASVSQLAKSSQNQRFLLNSTT